VQYGYFDKKKREYIITNPFTPTPWINYIGSNKYGGIISNTGGGYSFHTDPQNRRITRYRYNNFPIDRPGRYIYIRDDKTGNYWNPGLQPVQKEIKNYSCRHGLGYSIIHGERDNIEAEVTYFVPDEKDFEIWLLKIKNNSGKKKNLKIFSYAEFCFWQAIMDQQNVDWVQQINQGRYEEGIITWYPHYIKNNAAFVATSEKVHSFDTNLESFIGPYRGPENPIAVEQGQCFNSVSMRRNGVGAFCIELNIDAAEEKELVFLLGYAENKDKIKEMITDYLVPEKAHQSLKRLHKNAEAYLGNLSIQTADEDMNSFVNTWNQYQCQVTFYWSRSVSLYQLGIGRGMGIRDSAQDTLGVMHTIPEKAKELIIKLLQCQYTDGHAYHLFFPLTGEGGVGDAPVKKYSWYSDDHLWLVLATSAYLKETGNLEFLKEKVMFNDKHTNDNVFDHLDKAVEFTYNNRGPHNLALAGRADWNDGLNLDMGNGIAESLFTSFLYCRALNELIELCQYIEEDRYIEKYSSMLNEMFTAVNDSAWDGSWYIRAYDDEGNKVGSKNNKYAKIYLNTQSWAIIGGVTDHKRAVACLNSVYQYLNTKYGIVLLYPAYPHFDAQIGGLTTYPPGAKENGGIFLHANPWAIIAETITGNGNRAYQYYKQILPITRNEIADLFEVEPYVYPQNILGKEHPQFGTGRNSWLTGTASWNMIAASQYILGIRPHYDCLIIDPCIPEEWDGFEVKRIFRGATYNITIENPDHVNKGIKSIYINGKQVKKIPAFKSGTEHNIKVIMG
jgi:cellobiose phosphorylase